MVTMMRYEVITRYITNAEESSIVKTGLDLFSESHQRDWIENDLRGSDGNALNKFWISSILVQWHVLNTAPNLNDFLYKCITNAAINRNAVS